MTTPTVCIPWRATPDRQPAYQRVRAFWESTGWPIVTADSQRGKPFSLCSARNNAVRKASTDVVIVADADTIPDLGSVVAAVDDPVGVCWPFQTYRHIPGDAVGRADLMSVKPDQEYRKSVGGLFVCTQDTFWVLGGNDERFDARWGAEDTAFAMVARTLSAVTRKPGIIFSFNHSAERDVSRNNPNMLRLDLYRFANGKPDLMRELIKR